MAGGAGARGDDGLLTAARMAAAVRGGVVSATTLLEAHVRRHHDVHPAVNALVQPRHAAAAEDAARVDAIRLGALAGVPVSVKECFPVAGLFTTLGFEHRRGCRDEVDAQIVARLKAAGAVVVGKANVPQAMYLHETANPVWGRTNHPTRGDRGPGGSSGGDAALVAAGVVPLAVGNDLAGSLRQPAHACGVATIMPRSAVLGTGGAFDTLPHLESVRPRAGFLARDIVDLRLALAAVTGADTPFASRPQETRAAIPAAVSGMRVGWWDDAGPVPASPAVRRAVAEAVSILVRAGAEVVPLDAGPARDAAWLHLALLAGDGGASIRRLCAGSRPMSGVARLLAIAGLPRWLRPALAALGRLAGRTLEAEALLATGPRGRADWDRLLAERADVAGRFARVAAGCAAIVCPVSALPALPHGTADRLVLAAAPCLLANLLDLPAGSLPMTRVARDEAGLRPPGRDPVLEAAALADRDSAGLPVGVQVIAGPGHDEADVFDVMAALERFSADHDQPTTGR